MGLGTQLGCAKLRMIGSLGAHEKSPILVCNDYCKTLSAIFMLDLEAEIELILDRITFDLFRRMFVKITF